MTSSLTSPSRSTDAFPSAIQSQISSHITQISTLQTQVNNAYGPDRAKFATEISILEAIVGFLRELEKKGAEGLISGGSVGGGDGTREVEDGLGGMSLGGGEGEKKKSGG